MTEFASLPGRQRHRDFERAAEEMQIVAKMRAAIFVEPGRILLNEEPIPDVGPLDRWCA